MGRLFVELIYLRKMVIRVDFSVFSSGNLCFLLEFQSQEITHKYENVMILHYRELKN